jgi:hypothetical protein
VIGKIEEFNPSLFDYQILRQTSAVHYHWERPVPLSLRSIEVVFSNDFI